MYRFSHRLAEFGRTVNAYSGLLAQERARSAALLDLTVSNPTVALSDYPHAAIARALSASENFRYQPEPFGTWAARQVIARQANTGFLEPARLALTASTSEAYSVLFKLLCDPGDEVLVPTPSYPLFDYLAQLDGVQPRSYSLRYDGRWFIDFSSLEEAITPRTRAIVVVTPNNPTGSFLEAAELNQLALLSRQRGLPLISDEVFNAYAFTPSPSRVLTLNGRGDCLNFTLNGLSKSAGMPQLKLAWIAINGPAGEVATACARLELILDTYLSVSTPIQLAIEPLLGVGDTIQASLQTRVRHNLQGLDQILEEGPVHRLHAEGGWSAILRVPAIWSEDEWIRRLLVEQAVIVQPGYFFDLTGGAFLVLSLLTPEADFVKGVKRIREMATRV